MTEMNRRNLLRAGGLAIGGAALPVAKPRAQSAPHNYNNLQVVHGDVVYPEQSRAFTLENRWVNGNVVIGAGSSGYTLRNLFINRGSLLIGGSNFHGHIEGVWVESAPTHAFVIGELGMATCNAMVFSRCFARRAWHWGWWLRGHTVLNMLACSADQCGEGGGGGFLFNGATGFYTLTAETNWGKPILFYDCPGGTLASHLVAPYQAPFLEGGSRVQVF